MEGNRATEGICSLSSDLLYCQVNERKSRPTHPQDNGWHTGTAITLGAKKKFPLAPRVDCHTKIKPWVLNLPRLLAAKSQWNIYLKIALRSFPNIALRIPTAHNFTHDQRAHQKMAAFSLRLDLAKEVNCHFLENEYGDLSFFSVVLNWVVNFSM